MNAIEETLMWRRADGAGVDGCYHGPTSTGWRLCGTSLLLLDGQACHLGYAIDSDRGWQVRRVHVFGTVGDRLVEASIVRSPDGRWTLDGAPQPAVEGCTDVDLGFSAAACLFTRRRRALDDARGPVDVVRFDLRAMTLSRATLDDRRLTDGDVRFGQGGGPPLVRETASGAAVLQHPARWERCTPSAGSGRPAPVRLAGAGNGGCGRQDEPEAPDVAAVSGCR